MLDLSEDIDDPPPPKPPRKGYGLAWWIASTGLAAFFVWLSVKDKGVEARTFEGAVAYCIGMFLPYWGITAILCYPLVLFHRAPRS